MADHRDRHVRERDKAWDEATDPERRRLTRDNKTTEEPQEEAA